MAHPGKALLCDFDGTLADSLGLLRQAYGSFLQRFEVVPSPDEFDELNGPPLAEVVAILRRRHRLPVEEKMGLTLYNHDIAAAWPAVRPSHGAHRLLEAARSAGWRIAIVTSNDRARVGLWLEQTSLSALVDDVVGGEERPGKPDPAPYQAALRRLNADAGLSLAIEDSAAGYLSATAAGLRTLFYSPFDRPAGPSGAECLPSLPAALPLLAGSERDLTVRLAGDPDLPFLYGLRNDPAAILVSRTPRRLTDAELLERFRLDSTLRNKVTFILEKEGSAAAMVRFDRHELLYQVSIVVEQGFRGQGVGVRGLCLAIDAFSAMIGPVTLEAEIAHDNMASLRLFQRCGFRQEGQQGRFLRFIFDDAYSGTATDPGYRNKCLS